MMWRFFALLLFLNPAVAFADDINTRGLAIQKDEPTLSSGEQGGLAVYRDTSGLSGGSPGFVNTTIYCRAVAAAGVTSFEWCITAVVNNYAAAGENVAGYFQGNKFSTGATWGSVSEVADTVGLAGASVGTEIDNWTTGPDNGLRIGALVVVGDARTIRGLTGGGVAQGTTGVLIAASGGTPWARWSNAALLKDYTDNGLVLQGPGTRGIWIQGQHVVALDLGDATGQTAIRLRSGGRVTFDQHDQYGVRQDPATQDLIFDNAGSVLMRLTPGGHLYLAGRIHENDAKKGMP